MSTSSSSTRVGAGVSSSGDSDGPQQMKGLAGRLVFAWAFVGIPLAYGVFETAKKAAALFTG